MRQALGRGLDALIPSGNRDGNQSRSDVQRIPIDIIKPNRYQPRKNFDPEKLSELAQSIKENGLAQPIVVSYDPATSSYELVAGERRLRASKLAGLTQIEVFIKPPLNDKQRLAMALVENLQREDLNPIEEALGYLRLMKEFGLNQNQLSDLIGKSKSAVSNTLRLLELPDDVQKSLQFGQISEGHAKALLGLKNTIELIKLFNLVVSQNLSVRDVEDYVRKIQEGKHPLKNIKESKPTLPKKPADLHALEESLKKSLGTKVEIILGKDPNKGLVKIHFFSLEDFDKIINLLKI